MSRMTIIDTWSNIPITCEAKDQMRPRNFSCEIVRTISRRYTFGASFFFSIPPTIIEESRDRADRSSLAARPATQQPQKETRRINGGSGWRISSSGQPVDGHWMWWTRSTRSDARVAAIKVSIVYRMTYHALLTRLFFFFFFRDGYYRKRLPTRTVSPLLLLADGLLAGLVITGSFLIAPWTETSSSSSFIRSSLYVSAVEFIIKIPLQRPRLLSAIGFMDFASSFLILLPAAWLRVWSPDWRTAASAVQPSAESLAWFFRRPNAWAAAAPIRIHVNDDVRCDVTTTTSRHNTQVLPLVKKDSAPPLWSTGSSHRTSTHPHWRISSFPTAAAIYLGTPVAAPGHSATRLRTRRTYEPLPFFSFFPIQRFFWFVFVFRATRTADSSNSFLSLSLLFRNSHPPSKGCLLN